MLLDFTNINYKEMLLLYLIKLPPNLPISKYLGLIVSLKIFSRSLSK